MSIIVDTDYENWAVLVQCQEVGSAEPQFLSTRVLTRRRDIHAAEWYPIESAIKVANANANYHNMVSQEFCEEDGDSEE